MTSLKTSVAGLTTDVSNLSDNKANQITIAPFFNPEASYDPGDLVYYNGLSYRCVNAHEGEWDADDFSATTIDNELGSLRSVLTNLDSIVLLGTKNYLGGATVGNRVSLSSDIHVLFARAVINGYYYSCLHRIDASRTTILFGAGSIPWVDLITLTVDNTTNEIEFTSEATVTGTKDPSWTVTVDIFGI